jgi:hypothetical protein
MSDVYLAAPHTHAVDTHTHAAMALRAKAQYIARQASLALPAVRHQHRRAPATPSTPYIRLVPPSFHLAVCVCIGA